MNVLNKIKSKKTKNTQNDNNQPQKIQTKPIQQPLTQQKKEEFNEELCHADSISSRSIPHIRENDLDEDNFSQYRLKKDKKQQMIDRLGSDEIQMDKKWKKGGYCMMVKKNYIIGDIRVLEGELLCGKESHIEIKKKMKLSCSVQTIPLMDSIAKVILSRVALLTDQQAIFTAADIIKIIEKGIPHRQ